MGRLPTAFLSLSAAALIGIAAHEGYRSEAYIPVPGDRPTIGFGDAQGVKPGQKTDPVRAIIRLGGQVNTFEQQMKACVGNVPMFQHEWDAYVSLTFNIGSDAFCKSTLVRKLKAGDYKGACDQILRWDKFKGKPLAGLTKRRQEEHKKCLGQSK
jgi:lysozyme